jgi:hypothetical protein
MTEKSKGTSIIIDGELWTWARHRARVQGYDPAHDNPFNRISHHKKEEEDHEKS